MLNIALNTFREIVRNRFLYIIVFFAFFFILFSLLLSNLTLGESEKIIIDFGLGMIEIFGVVGVLFVGSQLLFKEIEGRTIFLILSKPIKRYDFILGKFVGFSAILALLTLAQSILFLIILSIKGLDITLLINMSLVFTWFKLEILLALVIFFSTFMGNMISILATLMVYVLSHSYSLLIDLAIRSKSEVFLLIAQISQLLFPPLEALNTKDSIGFFDGFGFTYFGLNSLYALGYTGLILFLTICIFQRKKFEN
ncbi:ABC transporter permease [Candidatus Gracilibacteria bacterium]|nr:ABC transporter permease [Candidatus Gracilibacteria bacterium]